MPLPAGRTVRALLTAALATSAFATAPARRAPARAALPHVRAGDGRIEGTVIISSALVARRPRFRIYNDPGPGALPPPAARMDSSAEMENVVVYVGPGGAGSALAATAPAGAAHATMAQHGETFEPHVLPVLRGTTVDFPNDDDVFHNVFSLSSAKTFDLGRYPQGSARSVTFDRAGRVDVFCHIHSDMSAIVLVLENPHFASPDPKGHFVLDSLPPGEYDVLGWHQRIRAIQQKVRVVAGQTTRATFTIPLPPPGAP